MHVCVGVRANGRVCVNIENSDTLYMYVYTHLVYFLLLFFPRRVKEQILIGPLLISCCYS